MHRGFVWGGRRHITFCLLSHVGGWGVEDWGYNRGDGGEKKKGGVTKKANLQRAMVLQSATAQRLIKRNFMLSCTRCNCRVPEDTESSRAPPPTRREASSALTALGGQKS